MSLAKKSNPVAMTASRERIRLREIWADSFITSPSWPVRVSFPLPGMNVPSMKRMSPPTGVQARPVTTPGGFSFRATSGRTVSRPRISGSIVVVTT